VGDAVMIKIIDIDLERRRVSLSLKQANEGVDMIADDFDPSMYGMTASYDEQGNYIYPEGFDPETNEWKPGHEEQQAAWEAQWTEARALWEAHKKQAEQAVEAEQEAVVEEMTAATYVSGESDAPIESAFAADETLQALKEQLNEG
jgi:small subunit ribosomal protein S1